MEGPCRKKKNERQRQRSQLSTCSLLAFLTFSVTCRCQGYINILLARIDNNHNTQEMNIKITMNNLTSSIQSGILRMIDQYKYRQNTYENREMIFVFLYIYIMMS